MLHDLCMYLNIINNMILNMDDKIQNQVYMYIMPINSLCALHMCTHTYTHRYKKVSDIKRSRTRGRRYGDMGAKYVG